MMPTKANPAMITLARESRGITQTKLSAALKISQGWLSKIENGQLEVEASDDLLRRLSIALNYPVDFFMRADLTPKNLPLTFFRRRKTLSKKLIVQVKARVNIMRFHVYSLLKSVEIPECRVPENVDLEEFGDSPESVAQDLRRHWDIPPGPIDNVMELLEGHGVVIIDCDFGTNKIDGLSMIEHTKLLPPIIFLNRNLPGDRRRWTLAHELAHIVLHHHQALPDNDTESQADRFTSEFLMPATDIRGYLGRPNLRKLAELKRYWKVSMQALIMRAYSLGKISENQKRYLFMQMGQLGFRTHEPIEIAKEEPQLIADMIQFHLTDLEYSRDELCELLASDQHDFLTYYQTRQTRGLTLVR